MSKTKRSSVRDEIAALPIPDHPRFLGGGSNGKLQFSVAALEYGTNLNDCCCDGPAWLGDNFETIESLVTESRKFEEAVCIARCHFMDRGSEKDAKAWQAFAIRRGDGAPLKCTCGADDGNHRDPCPIYKFYKR